MTTCTNTPILLWCIMSSPFCFTINIVCIRMRVFLTCEEYHKSSHFSLHVFVYLVNFCFASFLDVMLLYGSWQVMQSLNVWLIYKNFIHNCLPWLPDSQCVLTFENLYNNNSVKLFTSPYLVVVCVQFSSLYIHKVVYSKYCTIQYLLWNVF